MKIRYTPSAQADLREIRVYISDVLNNPTAAKNVTDKIIRSCHLLGGQPNVGASLQSKTGRETSLRFLVCGNHIVFYKADDGCISVVRILDGRTDYMKYLFTD